MTCLDILIYVEDPGAANYVAGLPSAIRRRGFRVRILAGGKATEQLVALDQTFEAYPDMCDEAVLLDAISPRLLVVGTSEDADSPALAMIDHARQIGISSVGLIDGPTNAGHRFRGRTGLALGHIPDWIVVTDEVVRSNFVALGAKGDHVVVGGHPRYEAVLERGKALAARGTETLRRRHFPSVPTGQKIVVFLSELSGGVNPHLYRRMPDYTLAGRGDTDGRTEIVLEEVLDALAGQERAPHFVVRLHPKNTKAQFSPWVGDIDDFSVGGSSDDLLEMLFAADLVIGLTTILMMEAALAGCQTLAVVPRLEEMDWLPSIALGLTACVSQRDILRDTIELALAGVPITETIPEDAVMPGALDRVADLLCDLSELGVGGVLS